MTRAVLAVALVCATGAAAERYDHVGAVGLLVAGVGDARASVTSTGSASDNGFRGGLEVGGTWAWNEHREFRASARWAFDAGAPLALVGGVRNGYQLDRLRTFFDLGVGVYVGAPWTIGPQLAVGLQYELLPVVGVYTSVGTHFGLGSGARFLAEVSVGFQFRTYLLE